MGSIHRRRDPVGQLQYDFIDWTCFTIVYGLRSGTTDMGVGGVRAVDLAGNRSAVSGTG